MRARVHHLAFERGGLVVVAALAVYVWLAPVFIVSGDNAEFAAIGARGGVPHPSGYPLYALWLRAMHWLPGATPAHTTAIATAVLAGIALLVVHAACRAWGASPAAATFAVAIYAVGPMVVRLSTEGDVFALNNLVAATVLWLAAARGPLRGVRRAAALGLVAGLGLSNHMSCALLAPVGILGLVRGVRESDRGAWVAAGLAVAALVVGLLPYLYLAVAPRGELSWSNVDSVHALVGHVLRMDYGGPTVGSPHANLVPVTLSLAAFAQTVGRSWLWAPPVIGVAALVAAIARPTWLGEDPAGVREPRVGWAMLAASWLLAGPLLLARLDVDPTGTAAPAFERFELLPTMLLALPIALGFAAIAARGARFASRSRLARSLPAWSILALFVGATALTPSLAYVARIHSAAVEDAVSNLLGSLPPNAVMITSSDDIGFGVSYAQVVLGERTDVVAITWSLMPLPEYRDRIARRGLSLPAARTALASVQLVDLAFAQGRPVFIDQYEGNIARAFPTYPYGPLFRVLPHDTKTPTLDEIVALNRAVFAKFDLAYPRPGPTDGFATEIQDRYADTWNQLAQALARAGKLDDAAWAQQLARQLAPES